MGNALLKKTSLLLCAFVLMIFLFSATVSAVGTVAYLGDARTTSSEHTKSPGVAKSIALLTEDINQIVPKSPTGSVNAVFMIGDFDHVSDSQESWAASTIPNMPHYYIVGNHEVDQKDMAYVRDLYSNTYPSYGITLKSGPSGTDKTTYSIDIGDTHLVNVNVYWNGGTNDATGPGAIPTALYDWISADLTQTTKPCKVVMLHEPLYPALNGQDRHVGDSLDANKAMRDKLQQLFVDKKVSVLVAAHTHYSAVNNVDRAGKVIAANAAGGVYHVDTGVTGPKTADGEDKFASIFYTHTTTTSTGTNLILTWKHDNSNSWASPTVKTYTSVCSGTSSSTDTTSPSSITNLAASNPTPSSVTLSWTAPGDDGSTGTASQYDVRYSTSLITSANFEFATSATGEQPPSAAGTAQAFTVNGLSANTNYYFAIKTADEVPNWSGISNIPSATTSTSAPDTTKPSITITCPPTDQTYDSNIISMSGTSSDNVGISKVDVSVDGGAWQSAILTALNTHSTSWSISGINIGNIGTHTVTARATDTASPGNTQTASITVTYQPSTTNMVETPTFLPPLGTYASAQTVTLLSSTSGATIRYTLDGITTPTTISTEYTAPITISSTKTIKAGAWKTGMTPSSIASATYTIGGGGGAGIATYIIYTDGSKVYAKKRITGTIDYTGTLNQVLSATLKSGNHVYIKNGAYSLSTITFPPNVIMECESNNAVIMVAADFYSIYLKSDSTIKGCTFDHKGKTKTIFVSGEVKNWRVENNYFINSNIAVIVENLNTPVQKLVDIPNNFPTSGWGFIVYNRGLHSKLATLEGTNKITITGNYFTDSNEDEFTDFNYNVHNVLFENNTFINHDGYSSGQEVIDMIGGNNYLTSYNIVRNNTIIGNFQTAIRPAKNNKHNIIENNYIEFKPGKVNNVAGIYFYGAGTAFSTPSDNKVINNRIVGAPIGIELSGADNNIVSGNKISNAVKGISLVKTSTSTYGSSVAPKNNVVTQNTINDVDYGIYVVSSPGNTISNNIITGYRIGMIYNG